MFGWLTDLLVKAPVVGSSCPCCEGQKQQLKKMQKAVLSGELDETEESGCLNMRNCSCHQEEQHFEMTTRYHYKL